MKCLTLIIHYSFVEWFVANALVFFSLTAVAGLALTLNGAHKPKIRSLRYDYFATYLPIKWDEFHF
jgi:hypothetical protein